MPAFPTADTAILDRLRHYDSPTICNVIELLGVRPRTAGYLDPRIRACFPHLAPMVGYASTATFRAGSPPRAGDVYAGLVRQVELIAASPGPAVIVFQDLDDPCLAATFGEVMCTTYKAFGAAGLITSGAGRDLEQVGQLAFPCFTNGAICSHGYSQIAQLDVSVRVGGITINPGDLLHGDCNGVTTIPTELASLVADACPELMEAESVVLNYLKAGKPEPKGYAAARSECHRRIEELSARLRKTISRSTGAG
jgi:regulator of RNase E activity RraA